MAEGSTGETQRPDGSVRTYGTLYETSIGFMSTFLFLKTKKSQYVWHRKEFDEIDVETTDRLMGEHLMDRKPVVYKCVCVCVCGETF